MAHLTYKDFEFATTATEIIPPIGGMWKYEGKLLDMIDQKTKKWIKRPGEPSAAPDPLGNAFHGKTAAEADTKAVENVKAWIDTQR